MNNGGKTKKIIGIILLILGILGILGSVCFGGTVLLTGGAMFGISSVVAEGTDTTGMTPYDGVVVDTYSDGSDYSTGGSAYTEVEFDKMGFTYSATFYSYSKDYPVGTEVTVYYDSASGQYYCPDLLSNVTESLGAVSGVMMVVSIVILAVGVILGIVMIVVGIILIKKGKAASRGY